MGCMCCCDALHVPETTRCCSCYCVAQSILAQLLRSHVCVQRATQLLCGSITVISLSGARQAQPTQHTTFASSVKYGSDEHEQQVAVQFKVLPCCNLQAAPARQLL